MRNVIYDFKSNSGYACSICKQPIKLENMFDDEWQCGHSAYSDVELSEDDFIWKD